MKYLNTQAEFLTENNDFNDIKAILREGLMKVAQYSHLVHDQIVSNIDEFLDTLNVGTLVDAVGNIEGVLGTGVFGAVFRLNGNRAMKITFDYREAPFLYEYSLKKRTKGIVKIKDIFKIKFGDTYAYIITRRNLSFLQNKELIRGVIRDLKRNGVNEEMVRRYREAGGLEYKIFLALKSMYDIDPNWRGTWEDNIAKQKGEVVLYDGFSKNIKLSDEEIPFLDLQSDINEAMVNKRSLDQLKKIRKMMKGIDIGDRIADESFPNKTQHHNINDVHIQSYEEYMKEPFKANQNVKDFKPKKK